MHEDILENFGKQEKNQSNILIGYFYITSNYFYISILHQSLSTL